MEVFVVAPNLKFSSWTFPVQSTIQDVVERVGQQQGLCTSDLYVVTNAKVSALDVPLQHGSIYRLEPRLPGGKGGFGSMLRALGAQIEKTTNREACRDLSGRRLRDVNHEKEMAAWLKKQAEREAEKEQRRAERLQRKLKEPKHLFSDPEYQRQCHDLSERLEDSVIKGLQASSSGQVKVDDIPTTKRINPGQGQEPPQKKKKTTTACFWTGLDELPSSEEDDDDQESSSSSTGTSTEGAEPEWNNSTTSAVLYPETSGARRTRSSEDQEAPGTSCTRTVKSLEDQEAPGTSGDQATKASEVHEAPRTSRNQTMESSEDQEAPGTSTNQTMEASNDQEAPGTSRNLTMESSENQEAPNTSIDQTTRLPEDQSAPHTSGTQTIRLQEAPGTRSPEDQEVPGSSRPSHEMCVDMAAVSSVEQLEHLGLDVLKEELMRRGLKCGGTLAERASRLFSVRDLTPNQIDPTLLAKPAKGKRK